MCLRVCDFEEFMFNLIIFFYLNFENLRVIFQKDPNFAKVIQCT